MDDLIDSFSKLSTEINNFEIVQRIISTDLQQLAYLYVQLLYKPNEFVFMLESNDAMDIYFNQELINKIYKIISNNRYHIFKCVIYENFPNIPIEDGLISSLVDEYIHYLEASEC